MKYQKIVLAGGNGYLGKLLTAYYKSIANQVIVLTRKAAPSSGNIRSVIWDGQTIGEWATELEHADLIINLCGKNVNCRYTPENRKAILESRILPTQVLGKAIAMLQRPPAMWINISSATIYRHAEDRPQDEATGEMGYGFSIEICKVWEAAFFAHDTPGTRKVALRMGIVLGRSDGAFPRILNLVKAGLGGRQGNGKQYMSWIHERDVARCTEWLMEQQKEGIFNCTAPGVIQNAVFMQLIRKAYGIPLGIPSPQWLLEMGAWLIGTETELLLKSRWVKPARLLNEGFNFHFEKAEHAIHDILSIRI